jgi:hypothetical protein
MDDLYKVARRDFMAAAALQGLLASERPSCEFADSTDRSGVTTTRYQHAARQAAKHADALIEALDAPTPAHEVANGE